MSQRDPITHPAPGDIVRSRYESIGDRHVLHVSECGIRYKRVRQNGYQYDGYCLPGIWTKWCKSHRVSIIQLGTS